MLIRTGHVAYTGPDAMDITRKGAHPIGLALAPEWETIRPVHEAKRSSVGVTPEVWEAYVLAYTQELRHSYKAWRDRWEVLLGYPELTLCCYCSDVRHCHRSIAAEVLAKVAQSRGIDATVLGESDPEPENQRMLIVVPGEHDVIDPTARGVLAQALAEHWGLVLTTGDHRAVGNEAEALAMQAGTRIAGYSKTGARYHWHRGIETSVMRERRWSSSVACDDGSIFAAVAMEASRGQHIGWEVHLLSFSASLPEGFKTLVYRGATLHAGAWA